jgi:hypothetical protein
VADLNKFDVPTFCNFPIWSSTKVLLGLLELIHVYAHQNNRLSRHFSVIKWSQRSYTRCIYIRNISAVWCEHTCFCSFWRAFAKRIMTIGLVIIAYPSVRVKQGESHWAEILQIKYLQFLLKYIKEFRFW